MRHYLSQTPPYFASPQQNLFRVYSSLTLALNPTDHQVHLPIAVGPGQASAVAA
jgi:hypothetical protein